MDVNAPLRLDQFTRIAGIYLICNHVHRKVYIGMSTDIVARWIRHTRELQRGDHPCKSLQLDYSKLGSHHFTIEVIEKIKDGVQLSIRESYWMRWYHHHGWPLYNKEFTVPIEPSNADTWSDLE